MNYFQYGGSKSKYHNVKTYSPDGIKFDSKKEANRYMELLMLQKAGQISDLQMQVRFEIIPKTKDERAAFYVADFVYKENGNLVAEDVKSKITRSNPTYILKRKLFKYLYKQYTFRES